jgi:hypothetical protein
MVAALVFGAQVHAQTPSSTPPGSTNPRDASATPGVAARAGADGNNSSGNPVASSATQTPGTTNPKDNVNPAPMGGTPARTAAPGMSGSNPITPGTTGIAGTTNPKDVVIPKDTMAKTADQRATTKADRASARAAKRAARASKKSTAVNTTAQTPGGDMSSTATSPSK